MLAQAYDTFHDAHEHAGCMQYATSVMVCGGYEDDADNGEDLIYTGLTNLCLMT